MDRELVTTLQLLAAADAQVLLVSHHALELAATLHADIEGAWWCDRIIGWEDGFERGTGGTISFALVLSQLRRRLPSARVLALSTDPCVWAALDGGNDRIIMFGNNSHTVPGDISVTTDQLIDAIWCVIDIRMHYRRRFVR